MCMPFHVLAFQLRINDTRRRTKNKRGTTMETDGRAKRGIRIRAGSRRQIRRFTAVRTSGPLGSGPIGRTIAAGPGHMGLERAAELGLEATTRVEAMGPGGGVVGRLEGRCDTGRTRRRRLEVRQ